MHIAKGTYKKDPQRAKARENEPIIADPIGDLPLSFMPTDKPGVKDEAGNWIEHPSVYDPTERQRLRAIWYELIADAAPGVLNRSHRFHLEATCRLMLKVRFGSPKTGDFANLNKFLTQMGMNPAAQSTVSGGAFIPAGGTSSIGRLAAAAQKRAG
jgi:hypothetical protein